MYAYYCLLRFKILPSAFTNLPIQEKAMVMAMIDKKIADDKKEEAKMKAKRGKR